MKTRFRLALAAGALAAAASGLPLFIPARAGTVEEDVLAFKEYLKTKPESQGIRNQIAELALKKDPAVVGALMPLLKGNTYDDDVKIAVLQSVGKQGDKSVAGKLLGMIDSKPWEEKPKLIAAGLEGVGDADAAGQYKEIIKLAKKYMDINGDIACAGFRAASLNVTRETVDDLIKELGRADYVTTADNAQKKAARGAAKPVIMDLLKKMTGKNIDDVKVWGTWWGDNKKTWTPPVAGQDKPKDLNASDTFVDDAYGVEIKKPNKAWSFRKSDGGKLLVRIEALEDGSPAAWVELHAEGTKNLKSKTPENYGKEIRENIEPKFRNLKEAEWDKKCSYSGLKGIEHILNGQHKDHDAIHMHNVFVDKSEVMFYISCVFKTGKKASLEADIEEILKSFKKKN